jgi:hypothetical protein
MNLTAFSEDELLELTGLVRHLRNGGVMDGSLEIKFANVLNFAIKAQLRVLHLQPAPADPTVEECVAYARSRPEIMQQVEVGNRIGAIKAVRYSDNFTKEPGLREAKGAIDILWEEQKKTIAELERHCQ